MGTDCLQMSAEAEDFVEVDPMAGLHFINLCIEKDKERGMKRNYALVQHCTKATTTIK